MSNFSQFYANSGGNLVEAPAIFTASTDDDLGTVTTVGYCDDKSKIIKVGDVIYLTYDASGTPGQLLAKVIDAGDSFLLVDVLTPSGGVVTATYVGEATWAGAGPTYQHPVAGVVPTDYVLATIKSAPTESAYLVKASAGTDVVDFELSIPNTSDDAVITYIVYRK